jgi:integrase
MAIKKKLLTNLPAKHRKAKKKPRIRPRDNQRGEKHLICDGEATVFRTKPSGDVWQFQMKVSHERYDNPSPDRETPKNKWLRKSLRTRDLDEAKRKGKELWMTTIGRVQASQPIFAPTTSKLVNLFLEVKKSEVGINKTMGRYKTIRTQLGWYLEFVGPDEKITDVDRNIWDGYYRFRRTHKPDVTDMTLGNEKSTIRSLYRWAIRLEYLPQRYLPEFPPISTEAVKRRALTVEEWRVIYEHMRSKKWTNVENPKVVEQRRSIYWFVLVLGNLGCRFGEARRLTWNNIKKIQKVEVDGRSQTQVTVNFLKSQTKNKKARTSIGRRGDVFSTIKRHSNFTKPTDYVFVDNDTGAQIAKEVYYKHWHTMLEETGLQERSVESITFYNVRHFFATQRLYSGVNPYALAKTMGCGITYIWDHYGQVDVEKMAKDLTKQVNYDKDGMVVIK